MSQQQIAIVGGGIVGSVAAYYLTRAGQSVTLWDEGTGQATKASAGIINPWFSLRRNKPWYFLVSQGAEFYRQLMQDLNEDGWPAADLFQADGALMPRKKEKRLARDLEQADSKRQDSPSIQEVKIIPAEELSDYFPYLESEHAATYVQGGGRVDGRALIETLHAAIEDKGGRIIGEQAELQWDHDHHGVVISSQQQAAKAYDKVLLAAGAWLGPLLEPLGYQVDVRPQKGQLFSYYQEDWRDQHWPVVMPFGLTDIIPLNNGELVIGATHEDDQGFDLTPTEAELQALEAEAREWMPRLPHDLPRHRVKVGTRAMTSDYSVIVGPVPEMHHVWAVSGLGSSGLTSGPYIGYQWAQKVLTDHWTIDTEQYPIQDYIQLS